MKKAEIPPIRSKAVATVSIATSPMLPIEEPVVRLEPSCDGCHNCRWSIDLELGDNELYCFHETKRHGDVAQDYKCHNHEQQPT